MKAFAALLENLVYTPQRNGKIRLLVDYFQHTPDPDRGWGLAILAGSIELPGAKASMVRELVESRVDTTLFALSYDYVGDLAETASLLWPTNKETYENLYLSKIVLKIQQSNRKTLPSIIECYLNNIATSERYALLKLLMGGLRVGVSGRLAKIALAEFGNKELSVIEELWFGLEPPYETLFSWLEDKAPLPQIDDRLAFRPPMLAHPIEENDLDTLCPDNFIAEWKWDGIRALLVVQDGERRLYSRNGDDISRAFPDILEIADFDGVLDGELLVAQNGEIASFGQLQRRLGRKTVTKALLADCPAHFRAYDILFDGLEDIRSLDQVSRRQRLQDWYARTQPERVDLSPLISFTDWSELSDRRENARTSGIEGLMLKSRDAPYVAGRPKGLWFKWKRDPLLADCVLMYAQRGHGKRSSLYSDYTFGCWRQGAEGPDELVPVGKAYSGFTNEELTELDRWVRAHATERFGPVRAVEQGLVFEVAFDSVQASTRHKSGLAMRFPRIHRIRWDKPPHEADRIDTLKRLID